MAVPAWPSGVPTDPDLSTWRLETWAARPIVTEMEGGNIRVRRRPGDNVATLQQAIVMPLAEYETFRTWGNTTLGGWSGRFSTSVWLGSAFATKVCQFTDNAPSPSYFSPTHVAVSMTLRVYDV